MTIVADLHMHSTASDGVDSPARVAERAKERGLRAIALTDHDSVEGVREARETGARLGVEVIAGVELTCYLGKHEIHMLGYKVDPASESLATHCRAFVRAREERAREIGRRLAELGAPVDMEAVVAQCDGGVVGRPHIAKALLAAGHVKTMQEAFDNYLATGKPACVPKMEVAPEVAINLIHEAGGLAVMAHPGLGNQFDLIPELAKAGLDGVEVWHSKHSPEDVAKALDAADRFGLMKTGGSDCHGKLGEREELMGRWGLDDAHFRRVKERFSKVAVTV